MRLPETARQILAGAVSAAAFLGLFFGMTLVWWIAFVGALAVYGAVLLIITRKPPPGDTMLTAQVSQGDLVAAGQVMERAAARLEHAGTRVPDAEQPVLNDMVAHVQSIRAQVLNDPDDYRRARRFISSYLGIMVDTVERYADLAEKSRGRHADRLAPLSQQIQAFVPVLAKIDAACLENDFLALESQVEALAIQLKRG